MPWKDWLQITDGCEQETRFPQPMEEGFLGVDEHSFATLLAMGEDLATQLNFYNLRHEPDGTWAGLFAHDETSIMASILGLRLKRIEDEFLQVYRSNSDPAILRRLVFDLAGAIDRWFRRLSALDTSSAQCTAQLIANMIESNLAEKLRNLFSRLHLDTPGKSDFIHPGITDLHPIWHMDTEEGTTEQLSQTAWERFSTYQSRMQAHAVFYALLNAVSALQKNVEELVLATLPSGKHPPALALFMAFLTLYRGAQEKINTFHQRHLEFYYRDVLHFSPQPCIADSTYLVFRLIPGVEQALIPAGTKFLATSPTDASKWLFRSEHDLLVNDIRVEALRTLYFERDCNVSPERELDYVTRIYAHAIPLSEEQEVRGRQSWSLFGSARMDGERPQGDPAHIGFALASPVLLLREGERKVDLALVFTAHSTAVQTITDAVAELCSTQTEKAFFHAFGRLFGAYLLAESDPLNSNCKKNILHWAKKIVAPHAYIVLANLLQKDRQDLFHALMQNLFLVDLTSKTGWYRVSGVAIRQMLTEGKNQLDGLSLSFTLGPEIGPITAYDVSLHGEGFSTRLPLIRLHLNPQAPFFACSLFDTLAVKKFHLTVNVKGIHQIQACNNHGNLDLDKPFHPFGPLPTTASFLIFGCYEAALKPLTRLRINLTWGDLPRDKEGFRSYYRSYNTKYSNEGFTTVPALLRDGHWTPAVAPSSDPIPLFVSVADSEQLSWQRRIDMTRLHHCRPLSSDFRESDYRYFPQTQNGFFKLPLTGPENAFGHALYPTLLSDTLTRNARSKLTRQQPMPQTPYTPIITRMALDYIAQTVITAGIDQDTDASEDSEKPFHIHPFGVKTIRAHADRRFHRLLPSFNDDGNLLIGLNGTRPDGPLTLVS